MEVKPEARQRCFAVSGKPEAWNTNGTEVMQPYCIKSSRERSNPSRSLTIRKENMRCPICNQPGTLVNKVRKITTAAGVGAGGYLAVSGSSTGAAIGTAICPGLGTLLGGVLGCLIGAAAGGVAGNSVGKMVDENIVRIYQCPNGHKWRAA